jgi:hypothetical protein
VTERAPISTSAYRLLARANATEPVANVIAAFVETNFIRLDNNLTEFVGPRFQVAALTSTLPSLPVNNTPLTLTPSALSL